MHVVSLSLDSMTWSRLPELPSPAPSGPSLIRDGNNVFLANPAHDNVMLFDQDDETFSVITGQGTGVTGVYATVIAVNDENLHGCPAL